MTENHPVSTAIPLVHLLPPLLVNCSINDFELGHVLDAFGDTVDPARFEVVKIRGLVMRRVPMPDLQNFCLLMGLVVPDNSTESSLLEALATKKMDFVAKQAKQATRPPVNLDPETSDDEQSSNLSPGELVKGATLEDVVIIPEIDNVGNIVMDEHGIQAMIATTIRGIAIKNIKVDILRPFCIKFGIKPIKKSKDVLARELAYSKQMDSAHKLTAVGAKQSSNQRVSMKFRLLNSCFNDDNYEQFINVNKKKTRAELDRGDAGIVKAGNRLQKWTSLFKVRTNIALQHSPFLYHHPERHFDSNSALGHVIVGVIVVSIQPVLTTKDWQ